METLLTQWGLRLRHAHFLRKWIRSGVLQRVKTVEEYTESVRRDRSGAEKRRFTNCFLLLDEVSRLIGLGQFYRLSVDNGVAFVDDESSYYYAFFYLDEERPIAVPRLDLPILAENVFQSAAMTERQVSFERTLLQAGFLDNGTYLQYTTLPTMPPEQYWSALRRVEASLQAEGLTVAPPAKGELRAFFRVYADSIDRFVQRRYSRRERCEQLKKGYLTCVKNAQGEILAIRISAAVHGGAIAAKRDCDASGYAAALTLFVYSEFYKNMPDDPAKLQEYRRNRAFGWIKTTNKASLRLQKYVGCRPAGKSMRQFVLPGGGE